MADEKESKKSNATKTPPRIEELRQMVREDIEEQREFLDKVRRKMN